MTQFTQRQLRPEHKLAVSRVAAPIPDIELVLDETGKSSLVGLADELTELGLGGSNLGERGALLRRGFALWHFKLLLLGNDIAILGHFGLQNFFVSIIVLGRLNLD